MAHGETLGILCLVTEPNGPAGSQTSISEFNVKLAVSVAEQAALSFANLKLRERLRYQSIRDPLTGLCDFYCPDLVLRKARRIQAFLQQQDFLIAFDASEFLFCFQESCVLGDLMVLINSHTWKLV
jgi:hypothetical protein